MDTCNIESIRNLIKGDVLFRNSEGYKESVNSRWNIDGLNYPLIIVNPICDEDIKNSILFSKNHNLIFTVRAGGHSLKSDNVDGLLLDLKYYKNIKVDENNKILTVGGGCLLGDVDRESQKFKLVIPTGQASDTGLAGLCLGGGVGHLTRSFGLTSDNLISINLIDCDGNKKIASKNTNSDLFWACKMAGSNFGVVTELTFKVYDLDNILLGSFITGIENGKELLNKTCQFLKEEYLPRELSVSITIDFNTVVIYGIYNGPENQGKVVVEKLSSYLPKKDLTTNSIANIEFTKLQCAFDEYLPRNKCYYKRGFFISINPNEELIELITTEFSKHPTGTISAVFTHLGGALKDFNDSPFAFRDSKFLITILSIIPTPKDKPIILEWTNQLFSKLNKFKTADYSNVTDEILTLDHYHGYNIEKLRDIKLIYDPNNFFKSNKNIILNK
ncbi:hypothetical protein DICPUDRAFT_149884 [Dictyostelium purpureum]|uniref:FAD-binding PCMH-type domain-containing protein n=1 Tax=Dictyostelium purpureum TaxID=5786 RepID=F0ZEW7_DICPU|nr:uncharacterized protein DICPUDRAFT_149884 [Dictyostelium purpureum]EGC37500.1 hypothetical protein DICPUDRAFT_149884 [Dictyostelium purpureum]|eukprot:XP_003285974.1 hypothetical protein DICPUDRAFT_149884 [Dictyostelium purpureum]